MDVQLVPVSAANIDGINALRLAADQMHGMAYPAYATWQGFFEAPSMRTFAFEASGGVVGFAQISAGDGDAFFYVERFAVGAGFQGRGVGRACFGRLLAMLGALKDKDKERGAVRLAYAAPTADFCPAGFYRSLGFRHTGEIEDAGGDEQMVVMELALDAGSDAGSDAADAPCPLAATNTVFRLIPEGERFAAIPSFPLSIQACDLALMDPQNAHIRAFYFGNSLGPMVL
ncbi:hypothetical protein BDR26DRAFT_466215 [Obelidium mucronatum]|nr:hypothetical protein BDR26DRAFT_466215 [Obelidium mucronatum]